MTIQGHGKGDTDHPNGAEHLGCLGLGDEEVDGKLSELRFSMVEN